MMELKSFLLILLMLASWTQQSDGTDCTLYTSSQPPTLNLLCPNSICRLRIQYDNDGCNINSDGCIPSCYIDNCNREYHFCNTTWNLLNASNETSPSWMSRGGGQTVYNNINCTLTEIPMNRESVMRCQMGDCSLTAQGNIDACSSDLGIDCDLNNYEETCIRTYNFCITSEHQPTTCQPLTSDTTISGMSVTCPECTSVNQCTETKAHTTTIYKPVLTPSTVYVSVCPSLTKSIPKISTTNVPSILSSTNTRSPSPTTCSPAMNQMELVPLNIVVPATGVLVGLLLVLLLVVTMGWVCTCKSMRKRGGMSVSVMQDSFPNTPNTNDGLHAYTETRRRFDNPQREEQKQATLVAPPLGAPPLGAPPLGATPLAAPPHTKPKPPQSKREEPVYAISLVSNKRDNTEPKNIRNGASQILSGGVSVGVVSQVPREYEHQYDHLVKAVKQKGGQTKRDNGVICTSEREYMNRVLEGPEDDYEDLDEQEGDNVYHILDGPTPVEEEPQNICSGANQLLSRGVSVGVATQTSRTQGECEHQYDKLIKVNKQKGGQSKRDERVNSEREHAYRVLEGPENDYDDLDEQEDENVYHILDGPTPLEEETQFTH